MAVLHHTKGSGEVELEDGYTFRFMIQGDRTPEVYGWVEKDFDITHKGGFWRTAEPLDAAILAAATWGLKVKDLSDL